MITASVMKELKENFIFCASEGGLISANSPKTDDPFQCIGFFLYLLNTWRNQINNKPSVGIEETNGIKYVNAKWITWKYSSWC